MNVLLTLPPHLLEKISAILEADLHKELDPKLLAGLAKAHADAEGYNVDHLESDSSSTSKAGSGDTSKPPEPDTAGEIDGPRGAPTPPPTIDEEALVALSRWATSDIGPVLLKRKGLDPTEYSLIALLAGTEVYVEPAVLARLRAAENPDQPDRFLPAYLSPAPPSLGSEYRALTRNLSTALNILFSIFGSAGAVYAASVGGAGYSRETAMLLAILAGVVVGVADGVLVWIFSERVKKTREEGKKLGREMLKGSSGAAVEKGDVVGAVEEDGGESAEIGVEGANAGVKEKREIRLRRRAVGEGLS